MKITELTLNAWVVFDDYTPDGKCETIKAQVIEIGPDKIVKCKRGDEIYIRSCDIVFPIVVTDDDLIRNGFKYTAVTPQLSDFSLASRRRLEDGEAEMVSNVSVRILDGNTESYDICIDQHLEWCSQRQNTMMFERWGLLFIHKLQNYLREVGFDELADNFKMDE